MFSSCSSAWYHCRESIVTFNIIELSRSPYTVSMEIKKYTIVTSEKIEMYKWIAMSVQADCLTFVTEERRRKKDLHRPGIEPGPPAWQASILPLNQRCLMAVKWRFTARYIHQESSCGRVVKATDSKSVSLWERRFESYQLRQRLFWMSLGRFLVVNNFLGHFWNLPATNSSIV